MGKPRRGRGGGRAELGSEWTCLYVGNVEAARCHSRCDQDRDLAVFEPSQRILALTLRLHQSRAGPEIRKYDSRYVQKVAASGGSRMTDGAHRLLTLSPWMLPDDAICELRNRSRLS